jgi:cobalt transporter subunit CbtA
MTGIVQRLFWTALLAGGIAGLVLAGVQRVAVVPMILKAETYETAGEAVEEADSSHAAGGAGDHGDAAWAPEDGAERTLYTFVSSFGAGVGFGLLLTACYALRGGVDWRRGILWGLGGFAVFNLAPAFGLAPELPGAAAAELGARQGWWILTVSLTAVGLALIAFASRSYFKVLGAVLIVVPHIVGAPHPETHEGLAPAELEHAFIYASLVTNAVFWVVLGLLSGYFFDRFGRGATSA